jgi:hypothetical protein
VANFLTFAAPLREIESEIEKENVLKKSKISLGEIINLITFATPIYLVNARF